MVHPMKVEYVKFPTRDSRSKYIAERFSNLLQGSVLDVGCHERDLKALVGDPAKYIGIDIGGDPDLHVNLEELGSLPFSDASFDTVVCTDVLEHIDNLHHVFGELVRVCKEHLIISLPNCWVNARQPIERGRGDFSHYGLPLERPMDRHKWFFNMSEVEAFYRAQAVKYNLQLASIHATEKPRPTPIQLLRRLRYPKQEQYLNRYAHTLWAVFERDQ